MAFPEETKKAFDFAADATKQLITVATGIITLTVLFSKDLDANARAWALASWLTLVVSVVFGLMVLLNLTGNLQNAAIKGIDPSIRAVGIRALGGIQAILFTAGILLLVVFGFKAAGGHHDLKDPAPAAKPVICNCAPAKL